MYIYNKLSLSTTFKIANLNESLSQHFPSILSISSYIGCCMIKFIISFTSLVLSCSIWRFCWVLSYLSLGLRWKLQGNFESIWRGFVWSLRLMSLCVLLVSSYTTSCWTLHMNNLLKYGVKFIIIFFYHILFLCCS